jgi:hypothetical protein
MGEKNFNIRMSEELLEKIKEEAKLNSRSATKELPLLIQEALEARWAKKKNQSNLKTP